MAKPQMVESAGARRVEIKNIGDKHDGVFMGCESRKINDDNVRVLNFAEAEFDEHGKFVRLTGELSEMLYATDLEKKVLPYRGHYITLEFAKEIPAKERGRNPMRVFEVRRTEKPVMPFNHAAPNSDQITDEDIPW